MSPEISAAIGGVERRDQTTDEAPNEPKFKGRRPSQQGHVNEHLGSVARRSRRAASQRWTLLLFLQMYE